VPPSCLNPRVVMQPAAGRLNRPLGMEMIMSLRYALMGAAAFAVAGIAAVQAQSAFPPVAGEKPSSFPPVGQQSQPSSFPPVGQQPSSFPPVGGQQSSPFPPVARQSSPFPPVGQSSFPQMGQPPPCVAELNSLAQEVAKRFEAVKGGSAKKLGAVEMCRLLTQFADADTKMIKSMEEQASACGIPAEAIKSRKAGHVQTATYKKQACDAAANPQRAPRATEPTLSDAFAPPAVSGSNTRTGRGTLDSLSGNPLAR
jgi:hypothetical protein